MAESSLPKKVRKRDGSVVGFDRAKIEEAIQKASLEVTADKEKSRVVSGQVTGCVLGELFRSFKNRIPNIEQIQEHGQNTSGRRRHRL